MSNKKVKVVKSANEKAANGNRSENGNRYHEKDVAMLEKSKQKK